MRDLAAVREEIYNRIPHRLLHEFEEALAADMAEYLRSEARRINGYTRAGHWEQAANKLDPAKINSRNILSYWNRNIITAEE